MPPTGMVKDKLKSNGPSVINARLIRECVHVTDVPLTEDSRAGGRGYSDRVGQDKHDTYLRSLAMNLELHNVTCLMLSHQGIGRIDNLVGLPNLTKLHLDNNCITRIENLNHLTKLEWLDLSFNQISVIEGLDKLVELQDLSLYSNLITTIKGLDMLPKLTCLSLGVNQIDSLDDTTRYLHKLKNLRMLTLSGNRIAGQKTYKNRVIAFVGEKLKYLDSRLVLPKDYKDAVEDQNEALAGVQDEDEKAKILSKELADQAEEMAQAAKKNCIAPNRLVPELENVRFDGPNVMELLRIDLVRDRIKEDTDKYEAIVAKAVEFEKQMGELYEKKKADRDGFLASLKWYSDNSDDECKRLIYEYEKTVKQVIPYGLRAQPNLDTYDDDSTHALRELLSDLKDELMEKEADQFDAFASAINVFEDHLKENYEKIGKEAIGSKFEEFRKIEKDYFDGIKGKMAQYFEDKSRNEGGTIGQGVPQELIRLLDNKEDCLKVIGEYGDLRTKRLDELEEMLKKNEDNEWRMLLEEAQTNEQLRSRARIAEIIAYIKRQEEHLNQWDAAVDAASA